LVIAPRDRETAFRFLHASNDEVYGTLPAEDTPFAETNPFEPNSPFAASKASSDHLVRAWQKTYGLLALATNCSNNFGPFLFPKKISQLVILNALNGKPLPIYGDGQQVSDWLFVKNYCTAVARLLASGSLGETYDIDGRNEEVNLDIVNTICTRLDQLSQRADVKHYAEQITYVKDRPSHDRCYTIDAGKIEREFGWKPDETFETDIEKTVQWYLNNP
jgi:dTDP-glucose 4,6-dehydratase